MARHNIGKLIQNGDGGLFSCLHCHTIAGMIEHERHMATCIELAKKAAGNTSPNPLVGCVLVNDNGVVAAHGYHTAPGMPHAEIEALRNLQGPAHGLTLYVNLEPCCHHGKTPPCTESLIKSGVETVVFGMMDPNPQVAGKGAQALRNAGIKVIGPVLEEECLWLNRAFVKWISTGIPWIILKIAATLDGRIADRNYGSRWVSGPESRSYVQKLRSEVDAILIGSNTAKMDNPELTVRELSVAKQPYRVVLDSQLATPPDSRLCELARTDRRTIIFSTRDSIEQKGSRFGDSVNLIPTEQAAEGINVFDALKWLGQHQVTTVLCEGGGRLAATLLESRLADELLWIVAPKLLLDSQAIPAIAGRSELPMSAALELSEPEITPLGKDVLIRARLNDPAQFLP